MNINLPYRLGIVLHMGHGGHGHGHGGLGHSHGRGGHGHDTSTEHRTSNSNNINVRAAFIHVLGDLIQSIGVLIAAYIIRFYVSGDITSGECFITWFNL